MRLYTLTKKFRIRFKGRRDPLLSYAPFQRFPPSFTRVEQRARWPTNLEERGRGEDRKRQRIVKRLKLLWSGGRGKGGFFCPEDLLVIKPNGRRNSPAISHRFGRRLKERGAVWSRSRPPRDRSEAVHRHFRPSWTSLAVHRTLRFHPSLSHLLPFFLLPPPFPEISPARFLAFEEIKV